ncbi:MAG: calcium-binding protein [Pseudomonadota bacterium]
MQDFSWLFNWTPEDSALVDDTTEATIETVLSGEIEILIGDDGNDSLAGGAGDDVLIGNGGDDTLRGRDGSDLIAGDAGDDEIRGGAGNDVLDGDEGDDELFGGAGDDGILGGAGNDVASGGNGNDLLIGGEGDDILRGNKGSDFLSGGNGNDELKGGAEADTLEGDAGDDRLDGGAGDDAIDGGDGNDRASGGQGNDTIDGGNGDDDLRGGAGHDVISGGEGNDDIAGGSGDDMLDGGAGEDDLRGGNGEDEILGGDGNDFIRGGQGNDVLIGQRGDDEVFGGAGDDLIIWNNGDGSDLFEGNGGDDRVQVNFGQTSTGEVDIVNDDDVRISEGAIGVDFERFQLNDQSVNGLFALDIRSTETLEVNQAGGDDVVVLEDRIDQEITLELDGGDDTANAAPAASADDIATGDTLDLSGFEAGVLVDLDENNQGVLQAKNELSDSTAPGLSEFGQVLVDGEVAIAELNDYENVIGTEFDDTLFGNGQDNVLLGGAGDDRLHPFGGADFVDGGEGTDTLLLNGFGGGSLVDLIAGTAENGSGLNTIANIENVNGSTVAGDVILGDDRDDIAQDITFNLNGDIVEANGNVLNGLGGDDILQGRGGNDVLIGGDNADQALADATGTNADALNGGAGNDLLEGGAGADSFGFAAGEGADVIADFAIAEDTLVLDAPSFGVVGDVRFQNVARDGANDDPDAGLVGVEGGNNVYVLQGVFTGNAGGAADALAAELADNGIDEGAGFFVYFNTAQQINRLFFAEDLDDADAGIQLVANLGEFNGDAGADEAAEIRDALADFEADNFSFGFDALFA